MLFGHVFYFFMSATDKFKRLDVELSNNLSNRKILIRNILYQCTGFVKKYCEILFNPYRMIKLGNPKSKSLQFFAR